jgi:hypothetical protein
MVRGPFGYVGVLLLGFGFYILEGGSIPADLPPLLAAHPSIPIVLGFYCLGTDVMRQVRRDLKSFRSDLKTELRSAVERIDALLAQISIAGARAPSAETEKIESTMEQIRAALTANESSAA